eukprot:2135639-Rhodomonas_salina.1
MGPSRLRCRSGPSATARSYLLRLRYAKSGTDLAYRATRASCLPTTTAWAAARGSTWTGLLAPLILFRFFRSLGSLFC